MIQMKLIALMALAIAVLGCTNMFPAQAAKPVQASTTNNAVPAAPTNSNYMTYSADAVTDKTVLFFHASWCPSCRGLDKDIVKNAQSIPSDLKILKTDYDTQTELKVKYGVTSQHTLVQVDKDGNMIKKWSGGGTLESVLSQAQ
jgi:thiol-disulfide isomerase/thioredoxin